MKRISLFTVALVLIVGLVFTVGTSVFSHGWDFNFQDELSSVSGTVTFKRPGGYVLKTDAGGEYKLVMGPVWHLDNMGLELKNKDRITVSGFRGEDETILVTSVIKDGKTFELSDPDDWDGRGQGMMYDRSYYGHHNPRMWEDRGSYGFRRGRGCW